MARTVVGVNDAKAVKKYSLMLAADLPKESYFGSKFMGDGEPALLPIQRLTELETEAGEQITFDLSCQLRQEPIEGDNTQEGTEEDLTFYSASLYIDQMRCGVNGGGKMTRKRTIHKLRDIARKRMSEWWAGIFDEILFIYLSGTRGNNTGFRLPLGWTGRASNALTAPDSTHQLFQKLANGTIAATGTMTVAETMRLDLIDRAVAHAGTMGGGTQQVPRIQPVKIDGESKYVCVMHDWQEHSLRTSVTTGHWLDIQKSLATSVGKASPIFKGGLGEYNGVVLHKSPNVIQVTHNSVACARALFLGVQAAVVAFGSPGTNNRFDWFESTRDNGNQLIISSSSIFGVKKTTFNGLDYGVFALETAAANPNA